jgi:dTDP-4-amino-4,6-dideoxygalactose transaminase
MVTKMPSIPLVRTLVGDEEIVAVTRVLKSGQLAAGPEVAAFEQEFAQICGTRYAVAVNSGTAALHCALEAAGVSSGDEVVTTPFTFAATATPILMQRATPRFVDIDETTFNADLNALSAAVGPKTKAVIGVDLFGLPFATSGIDDLRSRGIMVIEDACQSIGASRNGISAGATADVGCFSLYATKNLMTGEGGMLTTDNDDIASAARRFRQHGQGERYEYLSLGYNYRMTDLAAAIGRVQLSRLDDIRTKRSTNARLYDDMLSGVSGVRAPFVPHGVVHAYHQYSIIIDESQTKNGANRDQVRQALLGEGIGCGVYYPTPLHLNPLFANLGYTRGSFPIAERVASQILALPIHPLLSTSDVERVASVIRDAVGS